MKNANVPELAGAAGVGLLGVFLIVVGRTYDFGSLSRMGPGFFPVALGALLILFALALLVEVWRAPPQTAGGVRLRPLLCVGLGICAFAAVVEDYGLVPATVLLVLLSSLSERRIRPVALVSLCLVLSVAGVVVFIRLLGIPLTAFGA